MSDAVMIVGIICLTIVLIAVAFLILAAIVSNQEKKKK